MIAARRAIAFAVCAAAFVVCWQVFAETVDNLWIRGLASQLEAKTATIDLPPSQDHKWQSVAGVQSCSSDTLYSALVIVLKKLDQQNIAKNHGEWASAMGSGQNFLTHMMQCLPTNANAPLRLAMVERSIAEDPAGICALVERSHSLAPNEALALSARMSLYNRLSKQSLDRCSAWARTDVRTILAYGRKANFSNVLISMKPDMRAIIRSEFLDLPEKDKHWARREYSAFMDEDGVAG